MNDTHTPQIGDIYVMSWGYDQTNVNFFQVTRLSKSGIFIREINSRATEGSILSMSNRVVGMKDSFVLKSQWCNPKGQAYGGNVDTFRKLNTDGKGFNIQGRYFAHLWDGSPKYHSWGA